MPTIEIRIPQLGEGLHEALIVRLLKKPGDSVRRDEPIYEMETDKATIEVESPYEGVLQEWVAKERDILPIGGVVAKMQIAEGTAVVSVEAFEPTMSAPSTSKGEAAALRNATIPPRTRAYGKEKGLTEEQLRSIPAASGKLLPADVDAYLSGTAKIGFSSSEAYEEFEMPPRQRTLAHRLVRTAQQVVPGTIEIPAPWEPVERVSRALREGTPEDRRPSPFLTMAWCAAKALGEHEKFRSTIPAEGMVRQYRHGNLGIAVALPDDELVTAVVAAADALDLEGFVTAARRAIGLARDGKDQAGDVTIHVSLTNMAAFGLRTAVPVVVPPSVATVFIGAPYDAVSGDSRGGLKLERCANLVMTFDHRLINGVGAATFLNAIATKMADLPDVIKLA